MLKKLVELEIPAASPFTNDALERKGPIEKLTTLVESTEQPFVLSVEAPWGWGKTTFIGMWKAHLESKGHVCLYFNAWENDFVTDPLIALVGEIKSVVESTSDGKNPGSIVRKTLTHLQTLGGALAKKSAPILIKAAATKLLGSDAMKEVSETISESAGEVADFLSETAKRQIEHYEEEKKSIRGFRDTLKELAAKVTEKQTKQKQIIFFVDELDRCRPDFAICLLERVKHLFNVHRVVFVLAVARAQLNQSVRALYGLESDSDGYLRRFIDLAYSLAPPTPKRFAETLYLRFGIEECFKSERDCGNTLISGFAQYTDAFGLSLRTQEQCFTEINIVVRLAPTFRNFPAVICFLVTLRAFRPGIFSELREKRMEIDTVLNWLMKVDDDWYRHWAEATLIMAFLDNASRKKRFKSLDEQIKSGLDAPKKRAQEVSELIGAIGRNWSAGNAATAILSALEMTDRFH
jgi:hypothetical protein